MLFVAAVFFKLLLIFELRNSLLPALIEFLVIVSVQWTLFWLRCFF